MKRWTIVAGALLLLVCLAVLSIAHAGQVSAENTARGRSSVARATVLRQIGFARSVGVPAWLLGGAARAVARIDRESDPPAFPVFDAARSHFLLQQTTAYLRLLPLVQEAVQEATTRERQRSEALARALRAAEMTARSLHLAVSPDDTTSLSQSASGEGKNTPATYRRIASGLRSRLRAVSTLVRRRQAEIDAIERWSHGSRDSLRARARSQIAGSRNRVYLLSLLRGGPQTDQKAISRSSSEIFRARTASAAALGYIDLQVALRSMEGNYARTVPSKVIVVSTERQQADLFQDAERVFATPVTTGGPELPTDHGIFHIFMKASPFEFHSPWPPSSPYYYLPTWVQYWMPFDGGEGLHDASWRSDFGPGSNLAPTDLGTGHDILGTHGCVNLPNDAAAFIWNWAPQGTTVVVV